MKKQFVDIEKVKGAGFNPHLEFVATGAVSALHYLRAIAKERGIPMEEITAEMIMENLSQVEETNKKLRR